MDELDQKARDMANEAIAKISAHEDVCEVRWNAAYLTMTEVKQAVRTQTQINIAAQGFVILTLIGMIAWLANKAF